MAVKMEMEERKVIVCIIGILIGVLVLETGIYFLHQEKHDSESRKIYTIVSVVGIFAVNTSDKSKKSVFFSSKSGRTTCKNDEIPV